MAEERREDLSIKSISSEGAHLRIWKRDTNTRAAQASPTSVVEW